MSEDKEIRVDDASPLLDRQGMFHKRFPSDFRQIRYFTLLVVQKAPPQIKEINLLEQQVSELIKNAVKHGNRGDRSKHIDVWYLFTEESARIIVKDQGKGFSRIEEWNEFNRRRTECFQNQDFDQMEKYVSFITEDSDENDAGNALFAALEYWDQGVVFDGKRNSIGVAKHFPKRRYSINLEDHGS